MATVPVVEDDELLLDSNPTLLARAGHQVQSAGGMAGVGDQLSPVDIVITDLLLPGIAEIHMLAGMPSVERPAAAVELGAARRLERCS